MSILILVIGLVQALAIGFHLFKKAKQANSGNVEAFHLLQEEVSKKRDLSEQLDSLKAELVDPQELKVVARGFLIARESLKAERGRVTITQAELETIEVRLRELEEISRELDASMTETKEELKILQRKESELANKNDQLKTQIADSVAKMDSIMSDIEMSAQMQEQIQRLKGEIVRAEAQSQTLLTQIQEGNEYYFVLKKRYDALDIEYAQLYEKFAEQQGT